MTTWKQYRFTGWCISHCVCAELGPQLLADLAARYRASVVESRVVGTWKLDYGGVYVDPPMERFTVFGLELRVPCGDVFLAKAALEAAEPRAFLDGARYYKLKLKIRRDCIVMTPIQAAALLLELAARADVAEQRAMDHYQAQLDQRSKRRP